MRAQAEMQTGLEIDNTQGTRPDYLAYLGQKAKAIRSRALTAQNQDHDLNERTQREALAMVDRIYRLLAPYVAALNQMKTIAIALSEPDHANEVVERDEHERPLRYRVFYRMRITVSNQSMVLRADRDCVDFFLLPAERMLSLYQTECAFGPFMTFKAQPQDGSAWSVEGKALTEARLERYTLLAFEYLLDKSQESI